MAKSSFSGFDPGLRDPKEGTSPKTNVDFSEKSKTVSGFKGVEDSRPRVDDNVPGKNRWPMGETKQVDGDKMRYGNNKTIGKGPKGI